MPDAPIPARGGISPQRVVLRGVVPADRQYWAGSAGDSPFAPGEQLVAGTVLDRPVPAWFHPDVPDESPIPFDYEVVHSDDDLIVVDKPPYLATMPRGRHITETVTVRLRRELDLPDLVPAHRLDRLTSGVLVCSRRAATRGAYQRLFQERRVDKLYRARIDGEVTIGGDWQLVVLPLRKRRGERQVTVGDGGVETRTWLRRVGDREVEARPVTGHTHQIRVVLHHLGMPIDGDDTYPVDRGLSLYDFGEPLHLRATAVQINDPVTGLTRVFRSQRPLPPLK